MSLWIGILSNQISETPKPTVSGGTLIDDGEYWVRKFNANDTLVITGGTLEYTELYVVGGGGSGG